ncbi:MAG TPA: glycosyltransferase [bacterium]|jgi:glycosyltransferase involved in cell wall biosynthesis|nr:glycosyltransferase [bacterium]
MPGRILFVSKYAWPDPVGYNNNVFRQARALRENHGRDVELLTWPGQDGWEGPLPAPAAPKIVSRLEYTFQGLPYHVVNLNHLYSGQVLNEARWEEAVGIGRELLGRIKPDIVHMHHGAGMWWIFEAARRSSIPAVFSAHDWGLGCLRSHLVKGEGGLCDGTAELDKCARCVWAGRRTAGRLNEMLVSTLFGERLLEATSLFPFDRSLSERGILRVGLKRRVSLNLERARLALPALGALIVANSFGAEFFSQFGIDRKMVHVIPWYYDPVQDAGAKCKASGEVTFGYIGRIAPDKGLGEVFQALESGVVSSPVRLVVAGSLDGDFAKELRARYPGHVGMHTVEWLGWLPHRDIASFFSRIDATLIPSQCMENLPLTLLESFAHKRPVIAPDIPTLRDYDIEDRFGRVFEIGSVASLARAIDRMRSEPGALTRYGAAMPTVQSSGDYVRRVDAIYDAILAPGPAR